MEAAVCGSLWCTCSGLYFELVRHCRSSALTTLRTRLSLPAPHDYPYLPMTHPSPPHTLQVQRSDDTEDKVRTRLVAYHHHAAAVAERYAQQRVEVDGDRDMEQVWADVEAALRRHQLQAVEL